MKRRHISFFMALMPFLYFSQISNDLIGLAKIGSEFRLVRIDPNNGNTQTIGTQTFSSLSGYINSANTCSTSTYIFGSNTISPVMNVMDISTGNVIQSFPSQMRFMDYNSNDGMYYGINGADFLRLNASTGTYSTMATYSIAVNVTRGGIVNPLNNTYVTFDGNQMVTFSCQNGTFTVSPPTSFVPYGLAFSKTLNRCFGVENNSPTRFCEVSLVTGSVTVVNTFVGNFFNTGNGASSGATIDEQSNVYSYNGDPSGKIVSINVTTGSIISSPNTCAPVYYLRYVCNNNLLSAGLPCSISTGVEENVWDQSAQRSTYYNLYGEIIESVSGVIMIEKRGNKVRKVVIEN